MNMKPWTHVTGFFFHHDGRSAQRDGRAKRVLVGHHRRPIFEALESRILLSVDLIGIPDWVDQGPGPMQSAQVNVPPGNFASGAVESIAVNPNNTAQIYVGTVNGGVWRTNSADPTNPDATVWTPLTDQQASLAMGDIAFSPLDSSGNTLFAGTGSFSSLAQSGGPAIGMLRTTDGGATWNTFALNPGGSESQVKTVLPTAIDLDPGLGTREVVLAGTVGGGGLYRSDDNGETYALLSGANGLPAGDISQLIVDPNNAQRFYAGVPNLGVYRGDFDSLTGVITWTAVNTGITGIATAGNVQIAGTNSGGTTVLFALLSGSSQGAFRSTNHGDSWTPLATPPALFQRDVTVRAGNTMVVDPTNDQVAYIATYGGGDDIFRYNPAGAGSWDVIDNAGALGGTAPHADARDLAFQGNNVLVEACDGGIYFIQNPLNSSSNAWHAYIGGGGTGLRNTEFHDIAWDSRFDVVAGASQDNGSEVQLGTGNRVWDHFFGGDGGDIQVDAATLSGSNQTIRYVSSQNMDDLSRFVFDSATHVVQSVGILPGGGLSNFSGTFVPHFELNSLDPGAGQSKSLAVGGGGSSPVYIATMPQTVNSNSDVTWTAVPVAGGFGTVNALAFGGRHNGVDNADVLYVGTDQGLFLRTTSGGTLTKTAFSGGGVADVALDPNDWQHAYVATSSAVWETTDGGATWTNRTGNLSNSNIQTIAFAERGSADAVLVGGLGGVFRMITNDLGDWHEYGRFLPNTLVDDLEFNPSDDVLIAGTQGRGAWKITNASATLTTPGALRINGDDLLNKDDTIGLIRDQNNPLLLDVTLDGALTQLEYSTIQRIDVNGLTGRDVLTIDFGFGDVIPVDGINYDGGSGGPDTLRLDHGSFNTVTYNATGPGAGTVDFGGGDVVSFENLAPVVDTTAATHRVFNDATGLGQTIQVVDAGGGLTRIDDGGTAGFESVTFAPPSSDLTVNAEDGNDSIVVDFGSGTDLVKVDGGTGTDALLVNGTAAADSIVVSSTDVTRGAEHVVYLGIDALSVKGGAGDDDLTVLSTSAAGVTLDGEGGSDAYTVDFGSLAGAVVVNDTGPLTDTDTLRVNGTPGDDDLVLDATSITRGAETVDYAGIEQLTLDAGDGNDTITINGTGADTTVLGGNGDDTFIVNRNDSFTLTLDGQEGSDSYEINLGQLIGPVVIDDTGTTGTDTLLVNGTAGDDTIILTDTSISGLGGGSPFNLTFSGIDVLAVDAKAGNDLVDGSALTISVTIYGGDGDDTLIGGSNDDHIYGQNGNDDLIGNLGSDYLDGGDGSDGILGDMGTIERELVSGGGLATLLTTQNGKLEALIDRPGTIRRKVTLTNEDQGGNDTLIGGAGDDYLHGGAGNDSLSGGDGIDALFGDNGDDTLDGGAGDDHLYGGAGNDVLDGGAGADIAYGGAGDDTLIADSSGDRLIDWFGNFNQFVTPGPGFGAPVIVRAPAPWAFDFLNALAADDGATNIDSELGFVIPGSSAQQANSGKGA
jgi:hypothetical protein